MTKEERVNAVVNKIVDYLKKEGYYCKVNIGVTFYNINVTWCEKFREREWFDIYINTDLFDEELSTFNHGVSFELLNKICEFLKELHD